MYYYHLDWSNREEFTNYFRDKFIPNHIPDFDHAQQSPWGNYKFKDYWLFFPNQTPDPKILELQDFLKNNFGFPNILYFIIGRHLNLPIHIDGPDDGSSGVHHTSLNLQISDYEGVTMKFFKKINSSAGYMQGLSNLRAWNNHEVELVDQFDCTNTWTLINTGVPHCLDASASKTGIPKLCLSVRFKGFPAFEDSLAKIKRNI
jgi:hypothetical protein